MSAGVPTIPKPSPTPPFSRRRHARPERSRRDDAETMEHQQSPTHHPQQTKTHPTKPPCPYITVPLRRRKNKPNPQNQKTAATSYATKIYNNIALYPTAENKPNQTQYSSAYEAVAAKPLEKLDPRRAGTKYDIPHTTSEIRPQFHRSSRNKLLAIAAGMPHNACHIVGNDHEL